MKPTGYEGHARAADETTKPTFSSISIATAFDLPITFGATIAPLVGSVHTSLGSVPLMQVRSWTSAGGVYGFGRQLRDESIETRTSDASLTGKSVGGTFLSASCMNSFQICPGHEPPTTVI